MPRAVMSWLLCLLVSQTPAITAQDEDDEARPGLWQQAKLGETTRQRVVSDVFVAPRTAGGEFLWRGTLLLKEEGRYQFHAFVDGSLRVEVGGRTVLTAETPRAQWASGPGVELGFGETPLTVRFFARHGSEGLRLYWSSESFPLEPLPYHVLFHVEDDSAARLAEAGQHQLAAYACRRCHEGAELELSGPSLHHVGTGTSWVALRDRLTRHDAGKQDGRMPVFGLTASDADAVLAYLARYAVSVDLRDPRQVNAKKQELPTGRELIRSVGCLACHAWRGSGQRPLFGGGDLDDVGTRRSRAWLDQWLRDPAVLNPRHRMPVFPLSDAERQQIVAALQEGSSFPLENLPPAITEDRVRRGREVLESARCTACHEIPGPLAPFTPLPGDRAPAWRERGGRFPPGEGCLASAPHPGRYRPAFPGANAQAVAAALRESSHSTDDVPAISLLETKNCLSCHDRNGRRGLSSSTLALLKLEPQWQGQSPTLVPPPLTAVGDKLQNAPLQKAVRGEQTPRMPWLKVRMPRFSHTETETRRLTEELIAHDRIPPEAPATPRYPVHTGDGPVDPRILLAGRELTGGKGFSCVACHALKDYVPKQVALGTRGSDLYRLGERMRPDFFFRWTRSPLRIIPGVEMPSYTRPHATLLDGRLDRQLAAIWDALHDPQFTAPTNPAVVEQLWTLQPGDQPRIIRDVFTLPTPNGPADTVPRAFAVGFSNGHNVLFDLDRAVVRAWTLGDFARQRTQGKSWYWDLAGVTLAGGARENDFFWKARDARGRAWVFGGAWLRSYSVHGDAVRLEYDLACQSAPDASKGPEPRGTARVVEVWRASNETRSDGGSGWEREIRIHPPADHPPFVMAPPQFSHRFGEPRILAAPPDRPDDFSAITDHGMPFGVVPSTPNPAFGLRLRYLSPLANPAAALPPVSAPAASLESVTVAPGFRGVRLPLPRSIMPTAITWDARRRLAFTSLKGHVYLADDTDADGVEDRLTLFAEGLAAPFGIQPDDDGLLVAHKPEVLFLRDQDGDDRADFAEVAASGWGYTDDYHDWTMGLCRDSQGWCYIGLGSDYAHKNRPADQQKWRGHILRFRRGGELEDVASELRYPVGLTCTDSDQLLCSDQQGVQNCFNELNHIQRGRRYGVPALDDCPAAAPAEAAAVQIPHPWTRSVNGIAFWPKETGHPFSGQIVGAEFNQRALVRFSLQEVAGQMQGAVYPLSKFTESTGPETFLGPVAVAFDAHGRLYVGSLYDSGWLGGLNVGDIVRLTPEVAALPNGIREVRAIPGGFAIEFLREVDPERAAQPLAYKISGYTRIWAGDYATPDTARHTVDVRSAQLSGDGRTVTLAVSGWKAGHVYDIAVGDIAAAPLWPNVAHYTLNRLPP